MAYGSVNAPRKKVDTSGFLKQEDLNKFGFLTKDDLDEAGFLKEDDLEGLGFATTEEFEEFQKMYQSTYEAIKEAGYTGTETQFYAALKDLIENGGSGDTIDVNTQTVTLSTRWTEQSDGSHAQTINVTGVTGASDQAIWVDCSLSRNDIEADIAVLEAWSCINTVKPSSGKLTFYCYGDVPSVAIPTNVVVI